MVLSPATSVLFPFRFHDVAACPYPYPHFEAADFLETEMAESLLVWFEQNAQWQARELKGYAGYSDISLQFGDLPSRLNFLLAPESLSYLRFSMGRLFEMDQEGYVRVTAHRMLTGSTLKPHCDVAPIKFTHRLLIQLNRGWRPENGGLLCLFDKEPSNQKTANPKLLLPAHRSAFAFEISDFSFHAVTPVVAGERYTLSYTFYPSTRL
jgi:Rps23 Pro-64 3,4-dihydroxylase Tpa1-like proline 4-hydroxylase